MVKTYNDIYIETKRVLRQAGIEDSGQEARILLASAADKSPAEFLRDLRLYPGDEFSVRAAEALRRRLSGEPTAYIAGSWEFHGLELEVNPNVLIPRSDTEVVVDAALAFLRSHPEARVLDLCTGTGCIGLSIAAAAADCRVILADIDPRALMVAKRNAARHGLSQRVWCLEADALKNPARQLGTFDLLISNPPYIPSAEIDTLDPSVKDFEPHLALDGGGDGLDFYRSVFARWVPILNPGGCLALECGEAQAVELVRLGTDVGLESPECYQDTGGTDRAVLFRKPQPTEKGEQPNG